MRFMRPYRHRRLALLVLLAVSVAGLAVAGAGQAADAAAATNLVTNPGMETQANGAPSCWERVGYGANTSVFSSSTGAGAHSGTYGEQLTISNWVDGDHKSMNLESPSCAPQVTSGHQYDASVFYKSTTSSVAITVFQHLASGWAYWTDLKSLPATATWTQVTARTPPIPAGVDQITFGVSEYGNGTLNTDDYSLTDATATPPPPACTGTADQCANGSWQVAGYPSPVRSVHSILLNTGKILIMAGSGNDPMAFAAGTFTTSLWDPVAGTFTAVPTPSDVFCSGHVQLPNGNVLVMGGTAAYPVPGGHGYEGLKASYIFNVSTSSYQRVNDLNVGHWYPSATELGNGDVLSLGGLNETSQGTVETEYFNNATSGWLAHNSVSQTYHFWGLYPSMLLMQNGRLFYTGAHVFGDGLSGTGASIYDYNAAAITDVPGLQSKDTRDQAASVLLPPAQAQKVMILGGGNGNTNVDAIRSTNLIDLTQANPGYVPGPNLPQGTTEMGNMAGMSATDPGVMPETGTQGKMYLQAVLLPNRKVLETGGALHNRADPVYEASIYDPVANAFAPVGADPVERMYHSESFLLPDGRVASIGSNPGNGSFETRISLYSPAYLFQSDRPAITSVINTNWAYGSTQPVTISKTIVSASLLRPAAVTHSSDPNQRLVDLPLTVTGGTVSLNVTSNPNLAPPGWYMLTVADANGVPSPARWIHLG